MAETAQPILCTGEEKSDTNCAAQVETDRNAFLRCVIIEIGINIDKSQKILYNYYKIQRKRRRFPCRIKLPALFQRFAAVV